MKLTEKSQAVLDYLKAHGTTPIEKLAEDLGVGTRSVSANVTDLSKKGLATREKVAVEGADKPVSYVGLTDAGVAFVPSDEE